MNVAWSVSVTVYENRPREEATRELAPRVLKLGEEAAGLLFDLIEAYEGEGTEPSDDPDGQSFLRVVDDLMAREAACGRVADLAFLGRLELRRKMDALRALAVGDGDAWPVIAAAGSVLRGLRKAVSAVETSLCECEGLVPRLAFSEEIMASLAARRAYARFRFEMRCYAARPEVAARLHGAATSLAKLVGDDIYESLRVEDRIQLRELQRRVLGWKRGAGGLEDGNRLWQDVAGFAELTAGIRNRQELVRHDRELVVDLLGRLRRGEDFETQRPRIRLLLGRDDDLDEILLASRRPAAQTVQEQLERLAAEAEANGPSSFSSFLPTLEGSRTI